MCDFVHRYITHGLRMVMHCKYIYVYTHTYMTEIANLQYISSKVLS